MSKNLAISDLLDLYGPMLTDKQRDVIELYYNQDLSLAEIAEHEQITRQGVRDNIKRGEAFLLEMEEKLHFAEKFKKLVAVTEEITARSTSTVRANKECTYSHAIDEHAKTVRALINDYLDENF